ncbi:hypothetical protein [Streptomyces sp. NPDC091299]|uniref:hypothetical protein n=1 Tax=Streptomyces sp. NPDC091299 TaxID=3155302 RepID=UPI0034414F5E
MNQPLQDGITALGTLTAIGCIALGARAGINAAFEGRRIRKARTALRNQRALRAPITEAEIAAVDIDTVLANLTKENGR